MKLNTSLFVYGLFALLGLYLIFQLMKGLSKFLFILIALALLINFYVLPYLGYVSLKSLDVVSWSQQFQ